MPLFSSMKYLSVLPFSTWDAGGIVQANASGEPLETPHDLTDACARRLVRLGLLREPEAPTPIPDKPRLANLEK